jgi:predicted Co/Zn/Cd cation transporter (cation efflux family)
MLRAYFNTHTELGVLRISVGITVLTATLGVIFGLLSGSYSIVFDGVYELIDASMTAMALLVAKLIASAADNPKKSGLAQRFSMGFWQLEPIVLGLNGVLLTGAAIYALITAIGIFMRGGRDLAFDHAMVYAAVTAAVSFGMAAFDLHITKRIESAFLTLDAKSWIMSGAITAALLIAFTIGYAVEGTTLQWISPYIDPTVLILVCLVIIPMPMGTIKQALADILLVTPVTLKQHVDEVAATIVHRHGFVAYRSYVARMGRGRYIQLYFIVPTDWPPKRMEEWDQIRDEVSTAIGDDTPDRWLTIVFTSNSKWAT